MLSDFYRRHSVTVTFLCLLSLPVLVLWGEQVPSNNDIETWLPRNNVVRNQYDDFVETFGADESILIAFEKPFPTEDRIQSLAGRLSGITGIESCWTKKQVLDKMLENDVQSDVATNRLHNLMTNENQTLETLLVTIGSDGLSNRMGIVDEVRQQLHYCQLDDAILVGGPIVATQLDKLGSRRQASLLFGLTLLICFLLLRWNIGCWKTSGALMLANIFCIELTQATMLLVGIEMNFILSSLPVMVMVFTTAASIHFIGHYRSESCRSNGIGCALRAVFTPSAFATLTTIIGLASLAISDVGPIPTFGIAGAFGTFYSFLVGIFLTPAVLIACGFEPNASGLTGSRLTKTAMYLLNNPKRILIPGLLVTLGCAGGVPMLKSLISPLDFLPANDQVVTDTLLITNTLTSPTSIEAVVDFGDEKSSFVDRLRKIRNIEATIKDVGNVCHVLSVGSFFPEDISDETLSMSKLAQAAGTSGTGAMVADGSRLWRISIRLNNDSPLAVRATVNQLEQHCATMPIHFTGIGPLLELAQNQIFDGFWKSFASAFVLITLVMMLALRSPSAGLVAMIPNLTPILLIFGSLGWANYPIDIGIMMTASIALGLAVDGTFHFLFSFRNSQRQNGCRYRAVRKALLQTGMPIISSAVISGTGLLALGLSPFRPTMKFGVLMFLLLNAALIGDLLLLPTFLAIGAKRKRLSSPNTNTFPDRLAA